MAVQAGKDLQDSLIYLDQVVVTATRTPKSLKNVPLVTRVITANDIQKTDATTIEDLLKAVLPGVEFTFSMGQETNLKMQGFCGNAVLFLVDGERLAGETLDNVDYSRLNMDNVERIEIVKGAASSLYGSNAVGGVINIITRKPDRPLSVNLNGRWGAYGSQRYGATVGLRRGSVTSSTSIQHTSIDDINMKNAGDFNKVYSFKTWNFKENLTYQTGALDLSGNLGYFFRERFSSAFSHDRYRDYSGGVKANYKIDHRNTLELAYHYDQYDKSNYSTETKLDVRDYSNVQHATRAMYTHTFSNDNVLTGGGDFMRDYLMSYQFSDNGSHRQYTADVFAQFDWNITRRLNMVSGVRYDYFSASGSDRISAKLGFMYRLPRVRLRASYAGGFRAPTLKEMYMNFNMANIFMIYGNKGLKSEQSNNFQLSCEYSRCNYNVVLTGFYNIFENRISTAWNRELNGMQYVNTNNLDICGIDFNAMAHYRCGITASLAYVFTHEHVHHGGINTSATRPHTAVLRLEYEKALRNWGFCVALNGRWLSRTTADEYSRSASYEEVVKQTYPAYQLWKLTLTGRLLKGMNLTLTVDNLFNYVPDYYYNNSPVTRGTTFSCGLSVDLDKIIK